jgi:hypothetical protein
MLHYLRNGVGRVIRRGVYKRLTLSSNLKEKFVTDVKRITLSNSLTAATLNLEAGTEISEILVLTIDLKKQQFDGRIVENIARQNPHKLLFLLRFDDKAQLAVYYAKLYTTAWLSYDEITLEVKGFTLDAVWQGFLEQIALQDGLTEHSRTMTLTQNCAAGNNSETAKGNMRSWKNGRRYEVQPKKKFDLYQQLQEKKAVKWRNSSDVSS